MSEMVDRVARALAEKRGGTADALDRENARAAIEAVRAELDPIRQHLADNAADLGCAGYFRRSEDVAQLVAKLDAALK